MASKYIGRIIQKPGFGNDFSFLIVDRRKEYYLCKVIFNQECIPDSNCMIIPAGIVYKKESSIFINSCLRVLSKKHLKYMAEERYQKPLCLQ